MRSKWSEQFIAFWRCRIPLLATLLLVLLFFMPINSVQLNYFRPAMGIICVYYWRLNRPNLFGWFSAFVVGFVIDVYSSTPLGTNILVLLMLLSITDWPAHYLQTSSFSVCWFIFSLVCLSVILCKWLFLTLYYWRLLPPAEIILGYFSTIMFYPLIAALNMQIAQNFLPPENIDEQ